VTRRPYGPDHYTRRAKQQSYPARSVFKLQDIDAKHRILRPGQVVLDLGCAPGSWMLYAAQRTGPSGRVVGVDVHGVDAELPPHAVHLRADIFEVTADALREVSSRPYDVVLSDMAPHTSGDKFVDQQRSLRLVERALDIALEVSRPGASFVGKVFQSSDIEGLRARARERYSQVTLARPQATRKQSSEIYLVCIGLRAGDTSDP